MAAKKHGLGRGLDALIPASEGQKVKVSSAGSGKEPTKMEQSSPLIVRISQVEPDRTQPRKEFNEEKLEELAGSIRNVGVVEPLIVTDEGDHYRIISGERRWRAAQKAGLKEIPIIIRKLSEKEIAEIALVENIQRVDLNPIEEALGYQRLMQEFGYTQEEVAARISKNRATVANTLRLLKLTEPVRQMLIEEKISAGHARALVMIDDPDLQLELAQKAADEHLSVRDIEKLLKNKDRLPRRALGKNEIPTSDYHALEERLKASLGTKVSISAKANGKGRLEIEFYSNEDLEKIIDQILSAE
ncbi:MAG: ParB/RepB/Spo0J family partition protein [Lachnospiraceae bacterium]|nr:ParB/RepB/Spo0J family partition protein [Lachnospiraceae bacterium]MBQ9642883.1 ParB/RepB/Spo0J family partition protein [Lachnospiraceae bacterium]